MDHQIVAGLTRHCNSAAGDFRGGEDRPHVRAHQTRPSLGFMDGGDALLPESPDRVAVGPADAANDGRNHESVLCRIRNYSFRRGNTRRAFPSKTRRRSASLNPGTASRYRFVSSKYCPVSGSIPRTAPTISEPNSTLSMGTIFSSRSMPA